MRKILLTFFVLLAMLPPTIYAQGFISGSFQSNSSFYVRDSSIGAANLPHYDNLKVGTDLWFNLNYTNTKYDIEAGVRFDAFLNSILRTPTDPKTSIGIGNFFIRKKFKDITISAGYLYDQIGTGMIYRAYEERALGIDNALIGGRAEYNYKNMLKIKAFAGVQKNLFSYFKPLILGANIDGSFSLAKGRVALSPGIGIINRSLDDVTLSALNDQLKALDSTKTFQPKYNMYAFTVYNTLNVGPVTWYVEGSYKTQEAVVGIKSSLNNVAGNAVYTSLSVSGKGFGITLQFKRTENFTMRVLPLETSLFGLMNFNPPVPKQNSLRLPSRYFAPSLEQHELAFGGEVNYSPNKKWNFTLVGSEVRDFIFGKALLQEKVAPSKPGGTDTLRDRRSFFGEGAIEARFKPNRKFEIELGFQFVHYNRIIYQSTGTYDVFAYTPYAEFTHKFNKKMSYRIEAQYQYVPSDFGQWAYLLFEFNIAPSFSFAVSDMWNFDPNKTNETPEYRTSHHFYSIFASYTHGPHRFSLSYVRQLGGVVCTGGVCRLEPAFSGVRFAITSTF
jgi:hypothetical protein